MNTKSINNVLIKSVPQSSERTQVNPSSSLLDWSVALGGLWLIAGLYLDGWAHHRMSLESFFTPWHAVLYSGFLVTAAAVGIAFLTGLRRERNWRTALPAGYPLSLLGAVMFALGGLADMTWHTLFGIEQSLEALLSPPHLLLATGGSLLIAGPLRAAILRARQSPGERLSPGLPALFSVVALWGLLAFFTAYINPWMEGVEGAYRGWGVRLATQNQVQMTAGVIVQSTLLSGMVLLLVRRFRLPFGSLALLVGLTTLFAVSQHEAWDVAPLGLLGGLVMDGLLRALRPGEGSRWATQLFSFLAPFLLYALLFAALRWSGTMSWSLELWGGMVMLSGFTGWLVSFAFFEGEPA